MVYRIRLAIALLCGLSASSLVAGGSVFSANGRGEQLTTGGVRAEGMGGGLFGLKDSLSFSTANPALAAFAERTMIRIGGTVGVWSTTADGETDSDAETIWKDFAMYVPVAKQWVAGFGIEPQRKMDLSLFSIRAANFPDGAGGFGDNLQRYEDRSKWKGSAVGLKLNNAYRFNDKFVAGVNLNYTIEHNEVSQTIDFDTTGYRDVSFEQTNLYRAWSATVGIHVQPLTKLGIGLFYTPRSTGTWTVEQRKSDSDSTLESKPDGSGPGEIGFGVAYAFKPKWVGVLDARIGQWDKKDTEVGFGWNDKPNQPVWLSAGVEKDFRVLLSERKGGWSAVRGGVFFRRHYWSQINLSAMPGPGERKEVSDLGVSVGGSVFVNGGSGLVHFSIEGGRRGDDESALGASETFIRTSVQIELLEKWFQRRNPRGLK